MTQKIVLTISNPNNQAYPSILLHKFFNMVFIEPDGKTLSIYTATVFGGGDKVENKNCPPAPKLEKNVPCALRFNYSLVGGNAQQVVDVRFENLTDSFFRQQEWIEKVWGNITALQAQRDIAKVLKERYPSIYPPDSELAIPDVAHGQDFLTIEDNSKGRDSHFCIVCKGQYEGAGEKGYQLSVISNVAGVEAMNWVKSSIVLKNDILHTNEKLSFEIVLDNGSDFYTPDFTWYFAPPPIYAVDIETATLTIGNNASEKNKISSVADDTTVEFEEWIHRESITDRKKARANIRDTIASDNYALSGSRVVVSLALVNPERHGNTQFILGLVVAFLLSFCSDKTRLNDYSVYLTDICVENEAAGISCNCVNLCNLLGIIFPLLIILSFISLSFSSKRCFPSKRKHYHTILNVLRFVGVSAVISLSVYIYFLWLVLPSFMEGLVGSCAANRIIIYTFVGISLLGNLLYSLYCGLIRKNKILDFM